MYIKRVSISTFLVLNFFFINVKAEEKKLEFDPSMLQFSNGDKSKKVNLEYFSEKGSGIAPGTYAVNIIVNGEEISTQNITFIPNSNDDLKLHACLNADILSEIGVDVNSLKYTDKKKLNQSIEILLPGSKERFITNEMNLFLNIPQIYLNKTSEFKVSPWKWDNGLNVFFLNYDINGNTQKNKNNSYKSSFIGFNSGINLLGWRLRHNFNFIRTNTDSEFNTLDTHIQKSYSILQGGEITFGQTNTDGSLFDSIPISGVNIESDDKMLSSYMTTFSPVIKGVASSPSIVTVKQNGNTIFQKNVDAGPFEFKDIPQATGGQDFTVDIKGIDGKVRSYTQSSSTVPMLLRSGRAKYSLAIGKYNSKESNSLNPNIVQATMGWGFDSTTVYGGIQLSQNYKSLMIGVAKYFDNIGALSFDTTKAYTDFQNNLNISFNEANKGKIKKESGHSFRLNYARNFDATNTNFNLMGYRYAEKGFYTFKESQQMRSLDDYHVRSSISSTVSQSLNNYGSVAFSGSLDNYWNKEGNGHTLQVGYNTSFLGVFFNISASLTKNSTFNETDKVITMMLSRPFSDNNISTYYMLAKSPSGFKNQVGLSGTTLENNNLDYSVYGSQEPEGSLYTSGASANYHSSIGDIGGSVNIAGDYKQFDYNARGGLLVSSYGAVLSKPISINSGNALVVTPNAPGIKINNDATVKTNGYGLAVINGLSPFSKNIVSLDVNSVSNNIELSSTDKNIIPEKGAIVLTKFKTAVGYKALITLKMNGDYVPFGSIATLKNNDETITGIVDDQGMVYLGGLPSTGKIDVQWGREKNSHCIAEYTLNNNRLLVDKLMVDCKV